MVPVSGKVQRSASALLFALAACAVACGSSSTGGSGGAMPDGGACVTIDFSPVQASPIAWTGFPTCDPQSGFCNLAPAPVPAFSAAALSPSGTAFTANGNTIASWKGAAGNVYRIPTTYDLEGIFAVSDTDVWAVGSDSLVAHFDGSAWTTSMLSMSSALVGVWASGPQDVWAVGNFGVVGHYTGTWSTTALQDQPSLIRVHGTGPNDVWAVGVQGSGFDGVVEHWDGSSWSVIPASASGARLQGVWAASPTEVWIVGQNGVVLHGNAQGLSAVTIPVATNSKASYTDVWGTSPGDVWILGDVDTLHFDGTSWTRSAPLGTVGASRSASDMIALGADANHWDGKAWSKDFSLDPESFRGAWAVSPDDLWFVGDKGVVVRAQGGKLTRGTLGTDSLSAVWASSATDIWIADNGPHLYHGDGKTFCEVALPTSSGSAQVRALGGSGPHDVWAMMYSGEALHFDGSTWTSTATDVQAGSVIAFSPTDAWASGQHLRHWDGHTWTSPPNDFPPATTFPEEFGPIWGSAPDDVWVARRGDSPDAFMAHWDGHTFTQTMAEGDSVATLAGSAKNDVWSLGFYVRHYDGTSWSTIPSEPMVIDASVVTSSDVWGVGSDGLVTRKSK